VLGGLWVWVCLIIAAQKTLFRFFLVMTRSDDHLMDAVPTQKLEWVTPKISLMATTETDGKPTPNPVAEYNTKEGPS
jgi:hypothetical protein